MVEVLSLDNLSYFKTKQDAFNDSKFATKIELGNAISSIMTYKGTKATAGELPLEDNKVGDVWHVTADSAEYAWDGTKWEVLGSTMEVSVAWEDITGKPQTFAPSEHTHETATAELSGFMSAEDKVKLDGIANGATKYVHPDAKQLTAGLYKFATNQQGHVTEGTAVTKDDITALGIPAQDTTYTVATQEQDGLMASTDKVKLDGLEGVVPVENTDIDGLF